MKSRFLSLLLPALLAVFQMSARAEDIDLFTGAGNSVVAEPPNLLFVLDNAAAFSASANEPCLMSTPLGTVTSKLTGTVGGVEQCALYQVISSLTVTASATVKVGIMVYNSNGITPIAGANPCNASNLGGCLVYPLTGLDTSTKPALLAYIASWKASNSDPGNWIKANSEATAAAMQESWAYFYGKMGISGTNYASIAPSTNCKNFIVFIGNAVGVNGTPGDSAPANNGPKQSLDGTNPTALKNANPVATTKQKELLNLGNSNIPAATSCGTLNFPADNTHDAKGFYADEWARYLKANRVTTYGIGFIGANCKPDYPWLLSSMAKQGGGHYFEASNTQQLRDALENIFSEVRSVNSVFAAVSLPVSVNSQGTYLNQVFIGMFRPDPQTLPRWFGNLKQYKMGFDNQGQFNLLDADNKTAISASGSEFIGECARSFWTPSTFDNYWTSLDTANCTTGSPPAASNSPDGNLVEKGGLGYMLRKITETARVVKTCSATVASCQTAMTDFSTANGTITASVLNLGTATTPTVAGLISWARGRNNHHLELESGNLNGNTLTATDMRPSSHGDVVHSRPAAINFGTDSSPKVVVFYGGNDGMLRAINGNRTATFNIGVANTPVAAGDEFWSFVPPEYLGKLYRRYLNTDGIAGSSPKDYAMDGPITAYRAPNGDAWLYVGMRRGGRSLYAFHVNGTTLDVTLKWKRGCGDNGTSNCDASGSFNDIAQTWSAPTVFTALGYGGGTSPMLMVGGGYDAVCEDPLDYSCASPKGNKLYIIDAISGAQIASLPTARGIVADVTVVPDAAGQADLIYTADMGGNVYRISGTATTKIGNVAPASWVITTVASVGCNDLNPCSRNRKFMFAPDVVFDNNEYIVLLGSGNRERPTDQANTVSNYFFMIRDKFGTAGWLTDVANCGGGTTLCRNSLLAITMTNGVVNAPSQTDLAAKKGWYLELAPNEQAVTGAIAVFGTVYFTTHEPKPAAPGACVPNLGTSRAYAVKYKDASAARSDGQVFLSRDDAGLAPDLVVGKVTLDNDQTVPFCIGCEGPIKPSQPVPPSIIANPAKIRSYWYIQK
jgi:type IV pilus assembly protein PilY1